MKTLFERFEEKYIPEPNSGCWLWTARACGTGYGEIYVEGKIKRAHRVAYELHKSSIPEDKATAHGVCVLHRCDTPLCVNPDHLFLGTNADNMADKAKKGRAVTNKFAGETNGQSKLTESQAKAVYEHEGTRLEISEKFGISISQVARIKTKQRWAHIHE